MYELSNSKLKKEEELKDRKNDMKNKSSVNFPKIHSNSVDIAKKQDAISTFSQRLFDKTSRYSKLINNDSKGFNSTNYNSQLGSTNFQSNQQSDLFKSYMTLKVKNKDLIKEDADLPSRTPLIRNLPNPALKERVYQSKHSKQDERIKAIILEEPNVVQEPQKEIVLNNSPRNDQFDRLSTNQNVQNSHNHNELQRMNLSSHYYYEQAVNNSSEMTPQERKAQLKPKGGDIKINKNASDLKNLHKSFFGNNVKHQNDVKQRKFAYEVKKNLTKIDEENKYSDQQFNLPEIFLEKNMQNQNVLDCQIVDHKKQRLNFHKLIKSIRDENRFNALVEYIESLNEQTTTSINSFCQNCNFEQNDLVSFENDFQRLIPDNCIRARFVHCSTSLIAVENVIKKFKLFDILTHIEISNCNITDTTLSKIFDGLIQIRSVKTLNLSQNFVGSECLKSMMNCFGTNQNTFDVFKLADCGINLFGFIDLLKSLQTNSVLKILDIHSNCFDKYDYKQFQIHKDQITTFMYSNKTMTHLDISDCGMDESCTRFFYTSFLMRQQHMFIHTNGNGGKMFDNINMINSDQVSSMRNKHRKLVTGCWACDDFMFYEFTIDKQQVDNFERLKTKIVQLCLEYQSFVNIAMQKTENGFSCRVYVPKAEQLQFFTTEDKEIINLNKVDGCTKKVGQVEDRYMQLLKEQSNLDHLYSVDPHVYDFKKIKLSPEMAPHEKFKKPQVEHNNKDMVVKDKSDIIIVKNEFLKTFPKGTLKDIAVFDINNSKMFKFIQEVLKFENKFVIRFLNKMSQDQERIQNIQIYLQAINSTTPKGNQLIKDKTLINFMQRTELIPKFISIDQFTLIWTNVNLEEVGFEGNQDNEDDEMVRKELTEFLLRVLITFQWSHLKNKEKDINVMSACNHVFLEEICSLLPYNPYEFKRLQVADNEVNNKFFINKILQHKTFEEMIAKVQNKTTVSTEELWSIMKKLGMRIRMPEFHYHVLSSIAPTKDDFITKRWFKLDKNEFCETLVRMFQFNQVEAINCISLEVMETVFKIDTRQVIMQLNKQPKMDMVGCIMMFSHILQKLINTENKKTFDKLIDEFTKHKTLLYQANFFFDDNEYNYIFMEETDMPDRTLFQLLNQIPVLPFAQRVYFFGSKTGLMSVSKQEYDLRIEAQGDPVSLQTDGIAKKLMGNMILTKLLDLAPAEEEQPVVTLKSKSTKFNKSMTDEFKEEYKKDKFGRDPTINTFLELKSKINTEKLLKLIE